MRMRKAILLTMALLVVSGLFVGCEARSSLRIGWLESSGPRHTTARYRTFTGVERKSFRVKANQSVEIDYEITVEKGRLTLSLINPDGETVREETFGEAEGDGGEPKISFSGDYELEAVPQTGRYRLHIEGDQTGGSFDVSWQVEDG